MVMSINVVFHRDIIASFEVAFHNLAYQQAAITFNFCIICISRGLVGILFFASRAPWNIFASGNIAVPFNLVFVIKYFSARFATPFIMKGSQMLPQVF